jgi:hypothetical protein
MQYKPLDKDNEIRVLNFIYLSSPGSVDDLVRCSIENVSLERPLHFQTHQGYLRQNCPTVWDAFTKCVDLRDSTLEQTTLDKATSIRLSESHHQPSNFRYTWGDFEALSYTWGDRGDARTILVNGTCREVPRNLEEALRALRDLQETRLGIRYWVDSLCIDQKNTEERNEQVKRMREVYGRARAVVVWLGQEEKTDKNAVQAMRYLCRNPCVKLPLHLPAGQLFDIGTALSAFFKKPYWNRSWIIQELAMNRNSTLILCGKFKLTRRMIRLGATYCQKFLKTSEHLSYKFKHDLDMDAWHTASRVYRLVNLTFNPNVEIKLDLLLNLVRGADATDKKDKIYSILGLLNSDISADVIPNYLLSEQQAYTDFMITLIKKSGRLEQIVFGGIPTEEGRSSWVPDWRLPFERHHIQYLRSCQASGTLSANIRYLQEGEHGNHLVCHGYQVDTVDGIATEPAQPCYPTQSRNVSTRYSGRISEALQQTLLMNHPKATRKLLLKVPWILKFDPNSSPTNPRSTLEWHKLSQSRYFQDFDKFRVHNEDFCIGGKRFRDFFPQFIRKSVDITSTSRCMHLALLSLAKRALITTETGYLGLAPVAVRSGDVLAILLGCNFPVVLRPYRDDLYQVVGECYVHGLMDGEILSQKNDENPPLQEFVLC